MLIQMNPSWPGARRFRFVSSRLYWNACGSVARWRQAFAYGLGRLDEDQATKMIIECQRPARYYILLTLDEEATFGEMREEYESHPRMAEFVAQACDQVAYKWEDHGDAGYYAREWAIEKAVEYAAQEGIEFVKIEV